MDVTALVVAVNVAVQLPAATVMFEGTVAAALLLDSDTTVPPNGAGAVMVTVPVEVAPPRTLPGLTATLASPYDGEMASAAVCVPFKVALMVALVVLVTAFVLIVKVATELP